MVMRNLEISGDSQSLPKKLLKSTPEPLKQRIGELSSSSPTGIGKNFGRRERVEEGRGWISDGGGSGQDLLHRILSNFPPRLLSTLLLLVLFRRGFSTASGLFLLSHRSKNFRGRKGVYKEEVGLRRGSSMFIVRVWIGHKEDAAMIRKLHTLLPLPISSVRTLHTFSLFIYSLKSVPKSH